ncbi:AAA family ATPase [uncultured Tateyamaria sp.]|uniref:AAA family ATPase n=1 Tax=uncultured Tateyamaria sp. TaxID=455651 RepID=UPI0026042A36|nr:AAA family ATPase [uncultured Tateyamaria sp.]
MQIRHISIQNFKGIKTLKWTSDSAFCCLIGSGDVGKTSILDAIEATLSTRWITFAEADFVDCDTGNEILVEVTIGELSTELKSDERFGFYTRGWTSSGDVRDEPAGDDEPVLTVRLSVDATLEPVWELSDVSAYGSK